MKNPVVIKNQSISLIIAVYLKLHEAKENGRFCPHHISLSFGLFLQCCISKLWDSVLTGMFNTLDVPVWAGED